MTSPSDDLDHRLAELVDLDGVIGLLAWDEETYLPPAGQPQRARQSATLESVRHQRLVDPALGDLLRARLESPESTPDQKAAARRVERERERAVCLPERLVRELAEVRSQTGTAWREARAEDDYARFAPHFERLLGLVREKARAWQHDGRSEYESLLDEFEPGARASTIEPVFRELRGFLVDLVQRIDAAGRRPDRSFLTERHFPHDAQWNFTIRFLRDMGFDFEAGRQDLSTHPFTGGTGPRDVRVTTRVSENNLLNALFSTIHEGGHALFEQGYRASDHGTPLAAAPSMGLHESQSRLWENIVGRSRPFWRYYYPHLQSEFTEALGDVGEEEFFRAINYVEPSLIRVDADEVTYNLHIILRTELEASLVSGDLTVKDLPGAWREAMGSVVGVRPDSDREGCLQDIHWSLGYFGYFPTYTLGNLYSAQLFDAFLTAHPDFWSEVEQGRLGTLLAWLRERVHGLGYRHSAEDTVQLATGEGLQVEPFRSYLENKFSTLYGL